MQHERLAVRQFTEANTRTFLYRAGAALFTAAAIVGLFVMLRAPLTLHDGIASALAGGIGVVNFPPKQIGPIRSERLVTGFHNERGEVALCVPDQSVPLGTKLR